MDKKVIIIGDPNAVAVAKALISLVEESKKVAITFVDAIANVNSEGTFSESLFPRLDSIMEMKLIDNSKPLIAQKPSHRRPYKFHK